MNKKNITMCFRTSLEAKEILKSQAENQGRTTSWLINEIIEGYCNRITTKNRKELNVLP